MAVPEAATRPGYVHRHRSNDWPPVTPAVTIRAIPGTTPGWRSMATMSRRASRSTLDKECYVDPRIAEVDRVPPTLRSPAGGVLRFALALSNTEGVSTDSDLARRRSDAIARLGVLERAGDPGLTALARVGSYVTGARAGAVHILDEVLQHRIAAVGAPLAEHPREDSMCRLVVESEQRIVCADATRESCLSYSSFVQGPAPVRFYLSVPIRALDGAVIGTFCAWDTRSLEVDDEQLARFEDLAEELSARLELTRIAAALEHASSRDPLTGAVNRLVLSDRMAQAFARQRRHDSKVLVAVIDVDRFKEINDTHGHHAGDEVLIALAQRLAGCTRPEDTVARLGGDEFAVVAEMTPSGGMTAAEFVGRLEAALDEPIVFAGESRDVGVSIGAGFAVPGDDVRQALARADVAMYAHKARQSTTVS